MFACYFTSRLQSLLYFSILICNCCDNSLLQLAATQPLSLGLCRWPREKLMQAVFDPPSVVHTYSIFEPLTILKYILKLGSGNSRNSNVLKFSNKSQILKILKILKYLLPFLSPISFQNSHKIPLFHYVSQNSQNSRICTQLIFQ